MAYKLKTTGIAAHCAMCIAVDPDTGTVKDFASGPVTADLLVGANVTIGTQDWDGNTRHYWQPGAGTADADFVLFGANKPAWTFTTGGLKRTVVFIGEVAGSQARVFGQNSSAYFASADTGSGGATYPTMYGHGWSTRCTGGLAAVSSGQKIIFGFSAEHGAFSTAYAALHDAASMTVVTGLNAPNATSGTNNYNISALNRRNDSTAHQRDKTHAILIFDEALSESEWDSLRDDWFGTLLEVDAAASSLDLDADTLALSGSLSIAGDIASVIKKWRVPTTAAESTAVHVVVLSGTSPTYSIEAQGTATVDASGNADISGAGTIGTKALAFVHNYDDNDATTSINGGAGIATLVDAG